MKTLVLFAAVFFGLLFNGTFSTALAQDKTNDIWLGPYLTAGGAVSTGTVANGAKTDYRSAWGLGASSMFGISSGVAVGLDMGYDSRSINFHKQDDQNFKFNYTFNYFAFRPSIVFSDFMLGFGAGFPLGYSVDEQAGAGQSTTTVSGGASSMDFLFELRLGGSIPIYEGESGQLRFLIQGSYAFSSIVSNGPLLYFDPKASPETADNNGPLATAQIGLVYLFDLTHH